MSRFIRHSRPFGRVGVYPTIPSQRLAFVVLIVGSYLRMHEDSERADQPMLPLVCGDHGDTFYLLLVVFYEPGMLFKSRYILPAVEPGGIDQQPDLPMLSNERIDLRGNVAEVVSF